MGQVEDVVHMTGRGCSPQVTGRGCGPHVTDRGCGLHMAGRACGLIDSYRMWSSCDR
jgi:hypothetical protein